MLDSTGRVWSKLSRSAQIKVRRKFIRHASAMRHYLDKYVGLDNYAGSSSEEQLFRVEEKFLDCTPVKED